MAQRRRKTGQKFGSDTTQAPLFAYILAYQCNFNRSNKQTENECRTNNNSKPIFVFFISTLPRDSMLVHVDLSIYDVREYRIEQTHAEIMNENILSTRLGVYIIPPATDTMKSYLFDAIEQCIAACVRSSFSHSSACHAMHRQA